MRAEPLRARARRLLGLAVGAGLACAVAFPAAMVTADPSTALPDSTPAVAPAAAGTVTRPVPFPGNEAGRTTSPGTPTR